jgi:hypothetical protein
MTANRHFKRRVRERARRTGESYTAALRHLRRVAEEHAMEWQRIEKDQYGYAIHVPQDWTEREPDLKNSPWETARFGNPADRRHALIVFRRLTSPGLSTADVAERALTSLESAGFADFRITETRVADRPGVRLDCAKHDAGRVWAVREYFVGHGDVHFCLGCGSSVPEEDEPLFDAMAERFEVLSSA